MLLEYLNFERRKFERSCNATISLRAILIRTTLIRTDKNNRQQYLENKICNLNKNCNSKEILNYKIQKKDHYRIK